MTKGIQCYRCERRSPKASITYVYKVPLGPTCLQTLKDRVTLRGAGQNAKVIETPDGMVINTSDWSEKICPDKELHCLQCPYFSDNKCPLELAVLNKIEP